jgi:uncharacterized protein YcbK (DUF882 family)
MKKIVPFLFLIFALFLAGCGGDYGTHGGSKAMSGAGLSKTRPDPLNERHIVFLHPESGERLDTVYFHNGAYDSVELAKINRLFRDRHDNVAGKIDPELIDYLVDIRTRFNLPSTVVFEILSGFRTPATNTRLARGNKNVAIESLHMYGWAVDFRIPGVDGRAICEIAKTMQRGGVAFYPTSDHVHVDLGNIRTWKEK